jgi:hypothetical protein
VPETIFEKHIASQTHKLRTMRCNKLMNAVKRSDVVQAQKLMTCPCYSEQYKMAHKVSQKEYTYFMEKGFDYLEKRDVWIMAGLFSLSSGSLWALAPAVFSFCKAYTCTKIYDIAKKYEYSAEEMRHFIENNPPNSLNPYCEKKQHKEKTKGCSDENENSETTSECL